MTHAHSAQFFAGFTAHAHAAERTARTAGLPLALDDRESPDTPAEALDDVAVLPPEPPPPPASDAAASDAASPEESMPAPIEAEPDVERDAEPPPPTTTLPAPIDPTLRTRRAPPPAPPEATAPETLTPRSTPPIAAGVRPPLVPMDTPTPPAAPGGAPGATLVVVLEYTIGPDGAVTDAVVRGSSGSAALDASTQAFVRARWRYAPPGEPRHVVRRFVFTYRGGTDGG